jgi:hypothetical protein
MNEESVLRYKWILMSSEIGSLFFPIELLTYSAFSYLLIFVPIII